MTTSSLIYAANMAEWLARDILHDALSQGESCLQISKRSRGEEVVVQEGASGIQEPHPFRWRDAMDTIVKWRQLAEPNDQVFSTQACILLVFWQCSQISE